MLIYKYLLLAGPFTRYGKGSQSTRSTQWEVFRNPTDDGANRSHESRSRSSSQRVKKSSKNSTSQFKVRLHFELFNGIQNHNRSSF